MGESFGQWTTEPGAPRCPVCGVPVKWSVGANGEGYADCQDGARVSRRFPGVGPACLWPGGPVARLRTDDPPRLVRRGHSERAAILRVVHAYGPLGIRTLARAVGRKTRDVANDVEQLEHEGELVVDHPAGGYRDGQRIVRGAPC